MLYIFVFLFIASMQCTNLYFQIISSKSWIPFVNFFFCYEVLQCVRRENEIVTCVMYNKIFLTSSRCSFSNKRLSILVSVKTN